MDYTDLTLKNALKYLNTEYGCSFGQKLHISEKLSKNWNIWRVRKICWHSHGIRDWSKNNVNTLIHQPYVLIQSTHGGTNTACTRWLYVCSAGMRYIICVQKQTQTASSTWSVVCTSVRRQNPRFHRFPWAPGSNLGSVQSDGRIYVAFMRIKQLKSGQL